ncbi:MAG: MurR/RpiR family transcriptional regulator [Lautropia sp.]
MRAKDQILERFNDLSPALQQAARFVVDHPNEVVLNSMRALADHAGMQPATLVRLAQQLGYPGWPDLKKAFAGDYVLGPARPGVRASAGLAAVRGSGSDLVSDVFGAVHRNLDNTEMNNGQALYKAARLLRRARTVHAAGFRASFSAAYALVQGYRSVRSSVQLIDGRAGALEQELRGIKPQDAVVVFGFSPYCPEALQVQQTAAKVGARVVALTDSSASSLALGADVAILFSARGASALPSMAAAVAVTEALVVILLQERQDGKRER